MAFPLSENLRRFIFIKDANTLLKSLKIILNFNMLIVERGINRFIDNIIALRKFLYLEVPKLHNLRCTLDNGALRATPVELSTNVTEQFGTGYSLILPVTVFINYL